MVPAHCDFFAICARRSGALWSQMNAASSCLALQPSGPLRPLSPNKKFDTAPKEVYKKCVDICLNDFCYPRAKRAFDELPPSKIETNAVVRSHDGERIFAMERVRL
jgi:hypothetical protein